MPSSLSLPGASRPVLTSTGIALLHLGLLCGLALQTSTPPVLPDITPVQLIALAPEPAPAAPSPEPAATPAPPKPAKKVETPERKPIPKPAVKPDPVPRPDALPRKPAAAERTSPPEPAAAETSPSDSAADSHSRSATADSRGSADSNAAAGPAVQLPSTRASYLNNPKPPYPSSSKRMGETGTVLLRVLVGADGSAERVALKKSSGHDALDNSALETVRRWRFVPGKRNGVATAMEYTVPIAFRLE